MLDLVVVVLKRQPELLEVVLALHPPGRFAGSLHRRQEQCHQDADDGDDDEQLNQRKPTAKRTGRGG